MDDQASNARSDLIGGAGWVLFGTVVLLESLRMERFTKMGATTYTMPGFIPGILGGVLIILGLVLALRGWRKKAAASRSTLQMQDAVSTLINQRLVIALPLSLVYAIALLGHLPFWLATGLFITAFTYLFAPKELATSKRLLAAMISGVITTAVVVFVFQTIFLVRLP